MIVSSESDVDLAALIDRIPELVNGDAALVRRGRLTSVDLMLEVGAIPYYLSVRDGQVAGCQRGPLVMRSWSFAVRGSGQAWQKFWQLLPPPRFHDIFALAKFDEFRIEGDFRPLMTNLLYFKELIASPRLLAARTQR
jgi:hypothetical protein